VPLSAFGGRADPEVDEREIKAWSEHTRGAFEFRMYDGGHFFLHECQDAMLDAIREDLGCEPDATHEVKTIA